MSKYEYGIETDKTPTKYIVYKATNIVNNKMYIGITKQGIIYRISDHVHSANKQNSNSIFPRTIKKYGIENIKWSIIDYANSWEELCELEKFWIKEFNTCVYDNPEGLNIARGGQGTEGYQPAEELRKHLSLKTSEYFSDEKNRIRQSNSIKQYYEEHPEAKINNSQKTSEYFANPENRVKTSIATKRAYENDPSIIIRQQNTRKTTINKDEYSEKMSKSKKQNYIDNPKLKEISSENMKEYYSNPDNYASHAIATGAKLFNVYDKETKIFIGQWLTQMQCSRDLSITQTKIGKCLNGKQKQHKGYLFYYPENDPFINQELSTQQQDSSILLPTLASK